MLGATAEFSMLRLAVDYPAAWQVEHSSRLTRIIPPDDGVLITLGSQELQGASTDCNWGPGDVLGAYVDCWERFYANSPFRPAKRWSTQGGAVEVLELETSSPIGPAAPQRNVVAHIVGETDTGESAVGVLSLQALVDREDIYAMFIQMIETLRHPPVE